VPAEPAPAIQDLWHAATYMFEIKPAMFHSVFIRGSITALYLSYRGVTIRVARGSLPDITNPMHLVLFARSTQSMQDDFEIQVPDRYQHGCCTGAEVMEFVFYVLKQVFGPNLRDGNGN
jgi:hypothetical protein